MTSSGEGRVVGDRSVTGASADEMDGYIDEVRISKGIARWTSNFTPPSSPYTPEIQFNSISGLNFQPDLVWLKDRTSANNHGLFNSVRGATKYLSSNSTAAETSDASSLTCGSSPELALRGADLRTAGYGERMR